MSVGQSANPPVTCKLSASAIEFISIKIVAILDFFCFYGSATDYMFCVATAS